MVYTRPPPDPRRLEGALAEFVNSLNRSRVSASRFEEVFLRKRTPWTLYLPVEYAGTQWYPENGVGKPTSWILRHPEVSEPFARLWAASPAGEWRFEVLRSA